MTPGYTVAPLTPGCVTTDALDTRMRTWYASWADYVYYLGPPLWALRLIHVKIEK